MRQNEAVLPIRHLALCGSLKVMDRNHFNVQEVSWWFYAWWSVVLRYTPCAYPIVRGREGGGNLFTLLPGEIGLVVYLLVFVFEGVWVFFGGGGILLV